MCITCWTPADILMTQYKKKVFTDFKKKRKKQSFANPFNNTAQCQETTQVTIKYLSASALQKSA